MNDTIRTWTKAPQARPRRRKRPRTVAMVAAGVVVVASLTIGGIEPLAADGLNVNGCTAVPDSGYGFDFHHECDAHDRCYHSQPYGSGYSGRRSCDVVFRNAMLRDCAPLSRYGLRRRSCQAVATTYYYGVRILGGPFWNRQSPTPIA